LINNYLSGSLDEIKNIDIDRARNDVLKQFNYLYIVKPGLREAKFPPDDPGWLQKCLHLMQDDIQRIIAGAPPTTTPFMVYRGLQKPFGTLSGTRRRYAGFLSTSGDHNMSSEFLGRYGNLLCITVPPGQRCLLLGAFRVQRECEVLFGPRTEMQIDAYDPQRSKLFEGKNPLFVTIVRNEPVAGVKRARS
jgi:hypothetical protein